MAMLGGMEMLNGLTKAAAEAGTIGRIHVERTIRDCADVEWRHKTL